VFAEKRLRCHIFTVPNYHAIESVVPALVIAKRDVRATDYHPSRWVGFLDPVQAVNGGRILGAGRSKPVVDGDMVPVSLEARAYRHQPERWKCSLVDQER